LIVLLGTAKQHIDMLEEHILGLEEDIVTKDNEISELESKLKVFNYSSPKMWYTKVLEYLQRRCHQNGEKKGEKYA